MGKRILKKLVVCMLYYTKLWKVINAARHLLRGSNFVILVYHSFSNGSKEGFRLDSDLFEKHLRFLSKNFSVVSLDYILERWRNREPIGRKNVCITIDDGYLDNYELAYPILKKYGAPATIFVVSGYVRGCRGELRSRGIEGVRGSKIWNHGDELAKKKDIYRMWDLPMMSWKQLAGMQNHGISIGSHTVHHSILTKVPFKVAKQEIETSKRQIEENLGIEVRYFAFPNGLKGDYNNVLYDTVRKAGYDAAFVVDWGTNYCEDGLFKLKRIPVHDLSVPELAAKMSLIMSDPQNQAR